MQPTFIVWAKNGEYSSTSIWITATFSNKDEAEGLAARCNTWMKLTAAEVKEYDDDSIPDHWREICPDPGFPWEQCEDGFVPYDLLETEWHVSEAPVHLL